MINDVTSINPDVFNVILSYPKNIQEKIELLRELIYEVANATP